MSAAADRRPTAGANSATEANPATGAKPAAGTNPAASGGTSVFRLAVLASGSGSNLQAIIDQLHRHPVGETGVPARETGVAAGGTVPSGRATPSASATPGGGGATPSALRAAMPGVAPAEAAPPGVEAPSYVAPAHPAPPLIEVALVVSDVPTARALERARGAGIPTIVIPFDAYASREEHDLAMATAIRAADVDLVILAGYMRLVSPAFVQAFPWRIINLHPAILPAFPGTTSISDAVQYGVKVTGVTVHFVDEELDSGPIIAQETLRVAEEDTAETLATCIHALEHRLLPQVIRLIAEGKVRPPLPGSRVVRVDWAADRSEESRRVAQSGSRMGGGE